MQLVFLVPFLFVADWVAPGVASRPIPITNTTAGDLGLSTPAINTTSVHHDLFNSTTNSTTAHQLAPHSNTTSLQLPGVVAHAPIHLAQNASTGLTDHDHHSSPPSAAQGEPLRHEPSHVSPPSAHGQPSQHPLPLPRPPAATSGKGESNVAPTSPNHPSYRPPRPSTPAPRPSRPQGGYVHNASQNRPSDPAPPPVHVSNSRPSLSVSSGQVASTWTDTRPTVQSHPTEARPPSTPRPAVQNDPLLHPRPTLKPPLRVSGQVESVVLHTSITQHSTFISSQHPSPNSNPPLRIPDQQASSVLRPSSGQPRPSRPQGGYVHDASQSLPSDPAPRPSLSASSGQEATSWTDTRPTVQSHPTEVRPPSPPRPAVLNEPLLHQRPTLKPPLRVSGQVESVLLHTTITQHSVSSPPQRPPPNTTPPVRISDQQASSVLRPSSGQTRPSVSLPHRPSTLPSSGLPLRVSVTVSPLPLTPVAQHKPLQPLVHTPRPPLRPSGVVQTTVNVAQNGRLHPASPLQLQPPTSKPQRPTSGQGASKIAAPPTVQRNFVVQTIQHNVVVHTVQNNVVVQNVQTDASTRIRRPPPSSIPPRPVSGQQSSTVVQTAQTQFKLVDPPRRPINDFTKPLRHSGPWSSQGLDARFDQKHPPTLLRQPLPSSAQPVRVSVTVEVEGTAGAQASRVHTPATCVRVAARPGIPTKPSGPDLNAVQETRIRRPPGVAVPTAWRSAKVTRKKVRS